MKDTIVISEDFRNYLEGLNFEKQSRKELLIFMLTNNMVNEKMFKKIQTEYLEFFIQYELAKKQLELLYLRSKSGHWSLNFYTQEVLVYD